MKYMEYGLWYSCWTNSPPMSVSEASVDISKGRDQLGPRKVGVVETFCFNVSQTI